MAAESFENVSQARARGFAEGEAIALLKILRACGIEFAPEDRARIAVCTDLDLLETWIERAATATTIRQVFD